VVIVTPYIVRGVKNPEKLVSPTDGLEVPNDFERILLGKMEVQKPAGSKKGVQPPLAKYKLHGEAGYQLGE
jgi:Flp pilus assembly secretin CpaC